MKFVIGQCGNPKLEVRTEVVKMLFFVVASCVEDNNKDSFEFINRNLKLNDLKDQWFSHQLMKKSKF
eukprot:UN05441